MADFDLEQLRTLFQNLADRLSNTKGDENTVAHLAEVEKALKAINRRIDMESRNKPNKERRSTKEFAREILNEWEKRKPFKQLEDAIRETAGEGQGSIDIGPMKKSLAGSIGSMIKTFGDGAVKFGGMAAKFIDSTRKMDGTLSNALSAFGVTGGAAMTMARMFDENVSAYRSLVGSAEGTIGSIQDMRRAMSIASMNVEEFANTIARGTDGTRLMGAMPWAELFRELKNNSKAIGFYGMSLTQLANMQNEYLDILRERGSILQMDQNRIAMGFDSLVRINDRVAFILGKNREDMLNQQKIQNQDANFQMFLRGQNLSEDQVNTINALNAAISDKFGPAVASAFKDMQMGMGAGVTSPDGAIAFSMLLGPMQQTLANMAQDIYAGNVQAGDEVKFLTELRQGAEGITDDIARQMGVLGHVLQGGFADANRTILSSLTFRTPDEDTNFGYEQQDEATLSMLKMESVIKDLSSSVEDMVTGIINPLMDSYGSAMNTFVDGLGSTTQAFKKLVSTVSEFDGAIKFATGVFATGLVVSSMTSLMGSGIFAAMKPLATGLGKIIGPAFGKMAGAASRMASALGTGKLLERIRGVVSSTIRGGAVAGTAAAAGAGAGAGIAQGVNGAVDAVGDASKATRWGRGATAALSSEAMTKAASSFAKKLGPLAVLLEGLDTYNDIVADYSRKEEGEITDEEFKKLLSQHIAGALGGVGGGIVGAKLLGALGAAGGSVVAPGVGTLGGGVVGGVLGAAGGAWAGDSLGEYIGAGIYDFLLANTPETPEIESPNVEVAAPAAPTEVADASFIRSEIRDNFDTLNTSIVERLGTSNTHLEQISQTLTRLLEQTRIGDEITREGFIQLLKAQEDLGRRFRLSGI